MPLQRTTILEAPRKPQGGGGADKRRMKILLDRIRGTKKEKSEIYSIMNRLDELDEIMSVDLREKYGGEDTCVGCICANLLDPDSQTGNIYKTMLGLSSYNSTSGFVHECLSISKFYETNVVKASKKASYYNRLISADMYDDDDEEEEENSENFSDCNIPNIWHPLSVYYHFKNHVRDAESRVNRCVELTYEVINRSSESLFDAHGELDYRTWVIWERTIKLHMSLTRKQEARSSLEMKSVTQRKGPSPSKTIKKKSKKSKINDAVPQSSFDYL